MSISTLTWSPSEKKDLAKGEPSLRVLLFLFLAFFVLAPYLRLPGTYLNTSMAMVLVMAVVWPYTFLRAIRNSRYLLSCAILISFLCYTLLVGTFFYTETDLLFVKLIVSSLIYLCIGTQLGLLLINRGLSSSSAQYFMMKIALAVIFTNSIIVVVEYFFPPVALVFESVLANTTAIQYAVVEYKQRGIASGGGASLSVLHALGVVIAYALYQKNLLSVGRFIVSGAVIFISLLFIGRTGFVVAAVGVSLLFLRETSNLRRLFSPKMLFTVFVTSVTVVLLSQYLTEVIPSGVLEYSILFMLDGSSGLQEEGTLDVMRSHYHIPGEWTKLMFGTGTYSGNFEPFSTADPGLMKALTAFGIPLTILFYTVLIIMLKPLFTVHPYRYFVSVLIVLFLIVEIKEPFILQGYSARLLWLLNGVAIAYTSRYRELMFPKRSQNTALA